jgi:site-specific recombinase XerD
MRIFAQRLCASGVDPKTMQGLMRHSSPSLTLKVYVHFDKVRMSNAIMNLPSIASS